MRKDRSFNENREIVFEINVNIHAEGSCLVKFGNTHVLCTASIDEKTPPWLRNSGKGWVTAEYGMRPRSTNTRIDREAAKGKQSGRTQEIQRLIGRSLRAIVDPSLFSEMQILIDCDVLQADGGTRTASISGAFIALHHCFESMIKQKIIKKNPIIENLAAISCGVIANDCYLDLDYLEDQSADVDSNVSIAPGAAGAPVLIGDVQFDEQTSGPLKDFKLVLNGQDRFKEQGGKYFNSVQPFVHHTASPMPGIYSYSFALKPEEHQPTGTCNFSRIDNAQVSIMTKAGSDKTTLNMFATNYNVLRIQSGMGGLAFSN